MSEPSIEPIVSLTDAAVARVIAAMKSEGMAGGGLRLAVTKGGCSGYEYAMRFAPAPDRGDIVYRVGDLDVFIDPESVPQLSGTVLDYEDGVFGGGLKFRNPNATHGCGCGASFGTGQDRDVQGGPAGQDQG